MALQAVYRDSYNFFASTMASSILSAWSPNPCAPSSFPPPFPPTIAATALNQVLALNSFEISPLGRTFRCATLVPSSVAEKK